MHVETNCLKKMRSAVGLVLGNLNLSPAPQLLILDGSSHNDAHAWINTGALICYCLHEQQ